MRQSLASSIEYLLEQSRHILSVAPESFAQIIPGLKAGKRYPPSIFGLFADTVMAIEANDYSRAEERLNLLAAERPLDAGWQITCLGDGPDYRDELYVRYMDTDPVTRFGMFPPSDEIANSFRDRLKSGMVLMRRALPELAAEIEQIVSQVILVVGDDTAKYQFDGGSSYMLWGGLFLNATSHQSDVAIIEVLAHESAHLLLFGFASDESLVLNDDSELYPSPLRVDPRPMDGIYHSTYVSARMHWAMSELLSSGLLDPESRELAKNAMDADRRNFADGYKMVQQHGVLSNTGSAVMASAKSYMDSIA